MNLRHLEVYHAVMQTGSVSAAARRLNVSQPSVSIVLRHAEESLGVPLFERVNGRLRPTNEAVTLMPDVEEIFERVDLVSQIIREMKLGKSRELIVASSPTLANTILSRAVSRFRKVRPQTDVRIHTFSTYLAIDRVERREADMGLVYGKNVEASARIEHLTSSPIVCAIPATHRLARKATITIGDLACESIISLGPTTLIGRVIEQACRAAGETPPAVNIETSSSFAGCLMAVEGAGVALIDETTFLSDLFHQLIFRPFAPACAIELSLVLPQHRRASAAAEDLAQILRGLAGVAPLDERAVAVGKP